MASKKSVFKKGLFLFAVMGMVYINLEVITRALRMDLEYAGFKDLKVYSLAGWTSLWMFPVGGLCGLLIGLLNQKKKMHMALMSLFGTLIIFSIELLSGLFFNTLLGMNIWHYEHFDILGQVSLIYLIPWYFISPFAMWLDDALRFLIADEAKPSPLFQYYLNVFRKKQL